MSSAGSGSQPPRAPMASPTADEYNFPIKERKRGTDYARTAAFSIFFNVAIIGTHTFQLLVALLLYPLEATRPYYERGIRWTKAAFGKIIIVISQFFAPTKIVLTCSDEQGNTIDPEKLVTRSASGKIMHVQLPPKSVWISNHQIYTDWLYLWNLAYFAGLSDAIIIILMRLYKWVPIIGPAMQLYRFIFLERKWDNDKHLLARSLSKIAALASDKTADPARRAAANKLLMLIFPEGTLVSPLTRPASKKYAEKMGIEECKNLLLPRSTGLYFVLRSLAADIDDLKLIDFTIGYPGVAGPGQAQEYYTLRSTFMQGVAPPAVHMHMTILSLSPKAANAPPLGPLPQSAALAAKEEATEAAKKEFDAWLLQRWRLKDEQMTRFCQDGDFMGGAYKGASGKPASGDKGSGSMPYIELPTKLISNFELLSIAFSSSFLLVPLWWLFKRFVLRS